MYRFFLAVHLSRFVNTKSFYGKRFITKFSKIIKPKIKAGMIVKTLYGFKLEINPIYDKGIESVIYKTGIYEEGTLWCFKKILKKNDVVLDVGANIGVTSIYASRLVGNNGAVYAFEPLHSTFEILKRNIRINKLRNIKVYNLALSNYEGSSLIYRNIHINRGAASLIKSNQETGEEILVSTLDRFIKMNNIGLINFIKIDVEGSEFDVIQGGLNLLSGEFKPIICIEYSEDVKSLNKIKLLYDMLSKNLGYNLFKSLQGKGIISKLIEIKDESELPQHDNIYCFQNHHYLTISNDLFLDFKLNT